MKAMLLCACLSASICYADANLVCSVYNKDTLLTSQPMTLTDKDFPSNWARNNPAVFAANQYKPALCKTVGLGNASSITQADINGRKIRNVQVYQPAVASDDCKVTCVPA